MAKHELTKTRLVQLVAALTVPIGPEALPMSHWDSLLQRWVQVVPSTPLGPDSQPKRSKMVAQTVIDQALAQQRLADALGEGRAAEAATFIGSEIAQFVSQLNISELNSGKLALADVLLACAQFQMAAAMLDPGQPLHKAFESASGKLFEDGVTYLEGKDPGNDAKHR
jgi:hypothetical protein